MKPLDIVRTPKGGLAVVVEVDESGSAAIDYIKGCNPAYEMNAWWRPGSGLVVLDSIPAILANAMAHNMGRNTEQGDRFFGVSES